MSEYCWQSCLHSPSVDRPLSPSPSGSQSKPEKGRKTASTKKETVRKDVRYAEVQAKFKEALAKVAAVEAASIAAMQSMKGILRLGERMAEEGENIADYMDAASFNAMSLNDAPPTTTSTLPCTATASSIPAVKTATTSSSKAIR